MDSVVVIVMGGERFEYPGGTLTTSPDWLTVHGTSRTPIAVFAQHRVVRGFYAEDGLDVGRKA